MIPATLKPSSGKDSAGSQAFLSSGNGSEESTGIAQNREAELPPPQIPELAAGVLQPVNVKLCPSATGSQALVLIHS